MQKFQHVSYLWDDQKAAEMAGDEVALLVYRSNLLGADLRLTNYGVGNASCKVMAKDTERYYPGEKFPYKAFNVSEYIARSLSVFDDMVSAEQLKQLLPAVHRVARGLLEVKFV